MNTQGRVPFIPIQQAQRLDELQLLAGREFATDECFQDLVREVKISEIHS